MPKPPGRKSVAREYFESLVIAVVLALFVRTWVFQAFKIPSGSMEPNLLIGDHLIVNKMVFAATATAVERAVRALHDAFDLASEAARRESAEPAQRADV